MAGWAPVVTVVLSGSAPERTLIMMARELQDKLETLQEVLEVEIGGDRDEMVEILVAPLLMESYNLDQAAIYNLLSRNNRLVAAGNMDNGKGRFPIKVPSVFESISDVLSLPVKVDGDRVITFGDIAEIRRVFADPNSFARLNGKPAITLEVKKSEQERMRLKRSIKFAILLPKSQSCGPLMSKWTLLAIRLKTLKTCWQIFRTTLPRQYCWW